MTAVSTRRHDDVGSPDRWKSSDTVVALVCALLVATITVSMLGYGLARLDGRFTFNLVRLFHEPGAWISILVLSVFWFISGLVHQVRSSRGQADREPAVSGETGGGDNGVPVPTKCQGRDSVSPASATREVGG